jgi:hypothetical protein
MKTPQGEIGSEEIKFKICRGGGRREGGKKVRK